MKKIKKIGVIIGCILLSLLLLFILNALRIILTYSFQKRHYQETIQIPGNKQNYVPQGLAYSSRENIVLQTSYNSEHKVSMLYVMDFSTSKLLKSLKLKEVDGRDNTHHVGGVATDGKTVWITNDYLVDEYSFEEIMTTKKDSINSKRNHKLPIRGDFCYFKNDKLWIGDFYLSPFYKVPNNTPLLFQYNGVGPVEYNLPEAIYSLPKMVQGMVITDDNHFVFTRSFSFLIESRFEEYRDVSLKGGDVYSFKGRDIPYYHFKSSNLVKRRYLPPKAEGFFLKDGYYYILFENSSDTNPLAFPKIKSIIKMK